MTFVAWQRDMAEAEHEETMAFVPTWPMATEWSTTTGTRWQTKGTV